MLAVFTLSMSSFKVEKTNVSDEIDPCYEEAVEVGETMDGYNGKSGAYYALIYATTFCENDSFVNQ